MTASGTRSLRFHAGRGPVARRGSAHAVLGARRSGAGRGDPRASWGFSEGDEIHAGRSVVRRLGGGTRFEAYLVWDDRLHSLVVAKLLRPDRIDDRGRAALRAEAGMLCRLSHPGIVRLFDLEDSGPRPHLVMEFLDGPRLSTLLRRHGVSTEQMWSLALALASALHYMGEVDTVHLDVKPRNVIMTGPPRLIDMSVARTTKDAAALSVPVGTDPYMAPEQCDLGRGRLGPPADVWGLGVTLYEAASGALPFERRRGVPAQSLAQVTEDPRPLPPSVDGTLGALIMACLERDQANRPRPAELAAEIQPVVDATPRLRLGSLRPGARRRLREMR